MRITILTVGTRGDVQPYIALGLGLQAAGHKVRLATNALFHEFVISHGLDFAPVGGNPQEIIKRLKTEASKSNKTLLPKKLQLKAQFWRIFCSGLERLIADSWDACQDAEAIIYSQLALPGYHIAEKLGIPGYAAYTHPFTRTRTFPHPLNKFDFHLGGTFNWLTYIFEEQVWWQFTKKIINQWREETLKLPSIPPIGLYRRQQKQQIPILYCYSSAVVPKPLDWPDWVHLTGYWFLDCPSDWQPPTDLVDFLAAGPPPVYIGFGSMSGLKPEALTELVLEVLVRTGQRGILLTGWGGLSNADLPDNVLKIASAPHDWLFPQMAAVVHHGGAGTTAAGLRAGIPSVIIPFGAEQPFWGQRVADLGVGSALIPQTDLTVEVLASAIKTVTSDESMKARAHALGEKIRSEDGVAKALEIFHRYLP
ncbi:MAG: glycosyltransferase [Cyanomargarita calcarea GSE-NOS-MK-12-04C]|jgi:UDP:flavonoid glycosyltransferase YjiC (YdhE family)|uniref:Glycosyltransferase n=1 Tax=Cyanomargarita calcarea GSE-NOS-MK-12-04C TaxID=2839659 RepID=A0A951QQK0_9CYAN|nr:glycosyltransferase [Cyanomargarita calcarea GSE-NOS-MK-12-04C]